MISGVDRVLLDVDDQDKAKAFWIDKLGFELAYDETYGDERWVEVRPPNGSPVLVLIPRRADEAKPDVGANMPHTNVFFTCDDIQRTYEELTASGVSFPTPPTQMHFGWWSIFEDDQGTRHALSLTTRDQA
jgi:lactoylglutathione lyase